MPGNNNLAHPLSNKKNCIGERVNQTHKSVQFNLVTSILVTDAGDQICLYQDLDVGDKSRDHQELGTNIASWRITMLVTDVSPSGTV